MGPLDFAKDFFSDIPVDYRGPQTGHSVVPSTTQFTDGPDRSDFRLVPLAEGAFATARQGSVQVRDAAGRPLHPAVWGAPTGPYGY